MSDERKFDRFKIEWILVRDLLPHPKVQRPLNERWAKEIGDNFDPDKFRPLDVTAAKNGKYLVFAGQHRLAGAKQALGDDQRLPCHIHEEMPIERQADVCLGGDNMRGWNRIDKWRLQILAKQETPLKIEAILARHDLRVDKNAGEGIIRAVASLEAVYRQGGDAGLDRVLKILGTAYGRDKDACDGMLITGCGMLVCHFAEKLNDEDLGSKLARHSGPRKMIGSANDYAKTIEVSRPRAMAERMLKVYNSGRRSGGLAF